MFVDAFGFQIFLNRDFELENWNSLGMSVVKSFIFGLFEVIIGLGSGRERLEWWSCRRLGVKHCMETAAHTSFSVEL